MYVFGSLKRFFFNNAIFAGKNWESVSAKINRKQLFDALAGFSDANEELQKKKRKEAGLANAAAALKVLKNVVFHDTII